MNCQVYHYVRVLKQCSSKRLENRFLKKLYAATNLLVSVLEVRCRGVQDEYGALGSGVGESEVSDLVNEPFGVVVESGTAETARN